MTDAKWSGLEDKAFGFIKIPPRTAKPRERGLTIVADKNMGLYQLEDLLNLAGDYVDWLKIAISAPRIYSRQHLKDKIQLCHKHNVRAFFAGDAFELAATQGVLDQFFQEARDLGADGVEISTAQVYMDLSEKALLVEKAVKTGLIVFAEVGKKGVGAWSIPTNYLNKEIQALKDAGPYKIVIQGEGVVENVEEINEKPLFEIAARHDINDFVIQAKDNRAHVWLIKNFGLEVNMDIECDQVVLVELCRRGIRKRGLFNLVSSLKE